MKPFIQWNLRSPAQNLVCLLGAEKLSGDFTFRTILDDRRQIVGPELMANCFNHLQHCNRRAAAEIERLATNFGAVNMLGERQVSRGGVIDMEIVANALPIAPNERPFSF